MRKIKVFQLLILPIVVVLWLVGWAMLITAYNKEAADHEPLRIQLSRRLEKIQKA
jgi:hypothetical protein